MPFVTYAVLDTGKMSLGNIKMLVFGSCGGVDSIDVAICRSSRAVSLLSPAWKDSMLTDIPEGSGSYCMDTSFSAE